MPLSHMPLGTKVHCVEMLPGAGAKIARTAGSGVRLVSIDGDEASLKLPSGEIRLLNQTVLQPLVPLEMVAIKNPQLEKQEEVDG